MGIPLTRFAGLPMHATSRHEHVNVQKTREVRILTDAWEFPLREAWLRANTTLDGVNRSLGDASPLDDCLHQPDGEDKDDDDEDGPLVRDVWKGTASGTPFSDLLDAAFHEAEQPVADPEVIDAGPVQEEPSGPAEGEIPLAPPPIAAPLAEVGGPLPTDYDRRGTTRPPYI